MRAGIKNLTLEIIYIILSILIFYGCSSHERVAKETALAIERMNEEHRQFIENRPPIKGGEEGWVEKKETVDGIVALVNNDVILYSELERLSNLLLKKGMIDVKEDPIKKREAQRYVLDRLIEMKLIEQRAKEIGLVIKDSEIQDTVERIINQAGKTREAFIASLAKDGITYKEYLDQVRRELQKSRLFDLEVRPRIHISDEKCLDYYKKNIKEFTRQGRIRLQQIVILIDRHESNIEEIRRDILRIRDEILNGADFGEMARRYSQTPDARDGGDLGYFRKGELLPEIEEVAFSLKVGELSDVIRTDIGFHLIRVIDREEEGVMPFENVKGRILQKLINDALVERAELWMKELKERAYIDIRL